MWTSRVHISGTKKSYIVIASTLFHSIVWISLLSCASSLYAFAGPELVNKILVSSCFLYLVLSMKRKHRRGFHAADLPLSYRICKNQLFSRCS